MLDRFGLWDDWRTQELSCGCGWSGLGGQSVNLGSLNHLTGDRPDRPDSSRRLFFATLVHSVRNRCRCPTGFDTTPREQGDDRRRPTCLWDSPW